MELMVLLVFSRSYCFTKYDVDGTISSVAMEDAGTDHVSVEGHMVMNKDWLYIVLKLIEYQRLVEYWDIYCYEIDRIQEAC